MVRFSGVLAVVVVLVGVLPIAAQDGVFVRFRLIQPGVENYYVRLTAVLHEPPWVLGSVVLPEQAEAKSDPRVPVGQFTGWLDLKRYLGKDFHGRLRRSGGIGEFPSIMVQVVAGPPDASRELVIELATHPDQSKIVKRWQERFAGDSTSFLVSPRLADDAKDLETGTEMTARRLRWAREATGGVRHSPKKLLLQTSFWGPQRLELKLKDAEAVWLLGFNTVGNLPPEVREKYPDFRAPGASHDTPLEPASDRATIDEAWKEIARHWKDRVSAGAAFNFSDEVACRPPIGTDETALRHFHAWLAERKIAPKDLGVARLEEVRPIESPEALRERMKVNEAAARRVFYHASRFRQHAAVDRLRWNSEAMHRSLGRDVRSSTLVADHPYFGGSGLGMGMDRPNSTWGGWPLMLDWFDIGRRRVVDLIGIEDWMGLQYMFGPGATWEGFQLMGFQAAIFRSASRGELPIMAWITPSDERNLRLKAASSLCQGAKHVFFWTYGPTETGTENYWSDLPGAYPGMAHLSQLLAMGEDVIAPGKTRPTRVALLYSISSDLWQPLGYVSMLERRALYFSLIHDQYLVDFLTEEDLAAGRLNDYRALYAADPCVSAVAAGAIRNWVAGGGVLVGTAMAGSRNEFGEATTALDDVFGIHSEASATVQEARYDVRGALNRLPYVDRLTLDNVELGLTGVRGNVRPTTASVIGKYKSDASPAVCEHRFGKGRAVYFACTPGVSYLKDARFVPADLAEQWPPEHRRLINRFAEQAPAPRLVRLSHAVVETGLFDAAQGTALVLANFTYQPIAKLDVEVPVRKPVNSVRSLAHGKLACQAAESTDAWKAQGFDTTVRFSMPLGFDDLVILDTR